MNKLKLRKILPPFCQKYLFGDREAVSLIPDPHDQDWKVWKEKAVSDFYPNTQTKGVGNWVCNLAYPVVSRVNFNSKTVLEIGPGKIRHLHHIRALPRKYIICDTRKDCLTMSKDILDEAGIENEVVLMEENGSSLPFPNDSFDVIISFNSLEHLCPLDEYLLEMKKKLKHGGLLVGGVPCEGGIAWGLGRFFTTRQYVHKNYGINYDKIICWEHPNFADYILERLDFYLEREYLKLHPFSMLSIDFNLVASFVYKNIENQ